MTISSTIRKAGPYPGNGITASFPFSFKVFSASDLLVVRADATGVETTLALTTDYTVSLNADQDQSPGGTVTPVSVLATGMTLTLSSAVPYTQSVVLTNNGGFYPAVINSALDRATIQIQQLAEQMDRTFKTPISSLIGPGATITNYVDEAAASAAVASASASASASSASSAAASNVTATAAAAAAATSAANAAAPSAAAMAAYIDKFSPASPMVTFTSIYTPGGWDLGSIAQASPFPNETVFRRTSLSAGSGTFNFGTVP